MGLDLFKETRIVPERQLYQAPKAHPGDQAETAEYYVENLTLPKDIGTAGQREILMFVERMLNHEPIPRRVTPASQKHYDAARQIVRDILSHGESGKY